MTTKSRQAALLLTMAVLCIGARKPEAKLDQMAWLAGCWQRTAGDRVIDEQWMKPLGGMMMGMGRTVRAGAVVEFESVRIEEHGNALVYKAQPSGQAAAEFTSIEVTNRNVVFENKAHDFPQRILYTHGTADSLFARIEGTVNGAARGIDYKMARVRCGQ